MGYVQIGSGFIEYQHRGILNQGAGKNDPLPFASAQLRNETIFKFTGFGLFHDCIYQIVIHFTRKVQPSKMRMTTHQYNFTGCKRKADGIMLGYQCHFTGNLFSAVSFERYPPVENRSGIRCPMTNQQINQRCLSAAVGT